MNHKRSYHKHQLLPIRMEFQLIVCEKELKQTYSLWTINELNMSTTSSLMESS